MLCKCCVSLRGLAYFGASTHIVVGAMFFVEFLEGLFSISQSKLIQADTINIGTERLVYHWVFLSLGLLIFQGIDRESKTLLKRSAFIFLILQALTLAVRLKYGVMYSASLSRNPFSDPKITPSLATVANSPTSPVSSSSSGEGDIYRGLGLSILATSAYLMILFLYVRRLEASYQARLFRASLPASSQTHIPLSTTNLGWYSQNLSSRGGNGSGGCSRSSRGRSSTADGDSHSGTLYSPLNFFTGGFNPMVWTNPGPPPPYSDAAPSSDNHHHHHHHHHPPRTLANIHGSTTQPCSSRGVVGSSSSPSSGHNNNESPHDSLGIGSVTENKILNTSTRLSSSNERETLNNNNGVGGDDLGDGDPSAVPLLNDDESDDKNGLDC